MALGCAVEGTAVAVAVGVFEVGLADGDTTVGGVFVRVGDPPDGLTVWVGVGEPEEGVGVGPLLTHMRPSLEVTPSTRWPVGLLKITPVSGTTPPFPETLTLQVKSTEPSAIASVLSTDNTSARAALQAAPEQAGGRNENNVPFLLIAGLTAQSGRPFDVDLITTAPPNPTSLCVPAT